MLLKQSDGAWRRFYAVYLGAVLFSYVGFLLENHAIEQSVYFSGSWYEHAGRGFTCVLHDRGDERTRPAAGGGAMPKGKRYGSWLAGLAIVAVYVFACDRVFARSRRRGACRGRPTSECWLPWWQCSS